MATTVNTNPGAYIALQNLTSVQNQLQATQKRVSTGFTVADAFDNGAVFGVAQLVRGDIAGNAAASAELGNFSGALQTANAGATAVSNTLSEIRSVLTHLSATTLTKTQFGQYYEQYKSLVKSVESSIKGAGYNGTNLLSSSQEFKILADGLGNAINVSGTSASLISVATPTYAALSALDAGAIGTVANALAVNTVTTLGASNWTIFANTQTAADNFNNGGGFIAGPIADAISMNLASTNIGQMYTINNTYSAATGGSITFTAGANVITFRPNQLNTTGDTVSERLTRIENDLDGLNTGIITNADVAAAATAVKRFLEPNAEFSIIQDRASTVLNYIGALNRQVTQQLDFNNSIRNALSVGLGSLIDADLAQESSILTALQVKQQLSTQSLSIANQAPNILTSLFR